MGAQRVDQHGPLADQQVASPMQHQHRLLIFALHRHERHMRSCHCLGDGGGVCRVILLAPLNIGFDTRRWDQPDLMAQRRHSPCPVMGRRARFHAHQAGRLCRKELLDRRAPELLAHDNTAALINSVNLENMLGKIKPDGDNAHVDGPPNVAV